MGRFEVTTIAGDIMLEQVDASGGVHVESSSGDIRVQLSVRNGAGLPVGVEVGGRDDDLRGS